MANLLKVAMVEMILTLWRRGWSCRRIARELGLARDTVRGYVRRAMAEVAGSGGSSKPASAPLGSKGVGTGVRLGPEEGGATGEGESKPASAPSGSEGGPEPEPATASFGSGRLPGSVSRCEPWRGAILAKREQGLSAQRIY
jgi:hypothetical protein